MAGPEELVREMFKTYDETGDLDRALGYFATDVAWTDQVVTKETLHGHDGFRSAMERLASEGYSVQSSPEEFEPVDHETVLARGYTRLVQGEDSFVDLPATWAFVVRDGKIVRGSTASRRDEALAAVAAD